MHLQKQNNWGDGELRALLDASDAQKEAFARATDEAAIKLVKDLVQGAGKLAAKGY